MPKTRVAEIVFAVIENANAPMLKAKGYRRNGTHYYKSEPGVLRVLNVQSSQWNTADEGRFTITSAYICPLVLRERERERVDYLERKGTFGFRP